MSKAMLQACDRVGMLVIDEAFDSWTKAKTDFDYSLDFERCWEDDLAAMVRKDRNHPSVILYSIGNEIPEVATPTGAAWSRRLATRARELDPTRFVTAAINGALTVMAEFIANAMEQAKDDPTMLEGMGVNTFLTKMAEQNNQIGTSEMVTTRTAEAFATLDVAGMNYLDGRYEQDATLFPHRVIVGSETFPSRIDVLWDLVKKHPHVIGDFTWTGWDYLGEAGIGRPLYADQEITGTLAAYPWLTASSGDLDITGHRRPISYYREIVFGLQTTPFIAVQDPATFGRESVSGPWAWTESIDSWTWPEHEAAPIHIEIYSDGDEVELFQDAKSLGRQPVGALNRYRTTYTTTYQPGTLLAVAYSGGKETGRRELGTAGPAERLDAVVDRQTISAVDDSLAFIELALLDANGNATYAENTAITLELDGPGTLAAFGSADPTSEQSFSDNHHTTHHGRALAVIRPTGTGRITVTAKAPDLESAVITIDSTEVESA